MRYCRNHDYTGNKKAFTGLDRSERFYFDIYRAELISAD